MCDAAIVEAALYGDLVYHLRERWAHEAAAHQARPIQEETERINELIRAWLFAPQPEDLHGLTPREVIRNAQCGRPNPVSQTWLAEMLADEPELLILGTEDWHFGLAPDRTLIDDFDPEGWEARWAEAEAAVGAAPMAARVGEATPLAEARGWLAENAHPRPLAGNRFATRAEAQAFVERLYTLGAALVQVDGLFAEPERLGADGGPYADTLMVTLPPGAAERGGLYAVWDHELRERQGLALAPYLEADKLVFWWD